MYQENLMQPVEIELEGDIKKSSGLSWA